MVELRRLASESCNEEVKKAAQGALWILEHEKASPAEPAKAQDAGICCRDVHGNGIPNGTGNPVGIPWEWE